jgi:acetyltransferase-like isoleucine patch superfamily enzyme
MTLLLKIVWRAAVNFRSLLMVSFLKLLQGVLITRISWDCRIYGWITFMTIPANIEVGKGCSLGRNLFFGTAKDARIILGDNSSINTGAHIVAVRGIEIGHDTAIAEYVTIRDQNHRFSDPDKLIRAQGFEASPIRIGNDVWIGRGVFIGPGIEIGDGAVIGANSVVTTNIPPYSVAVGAPARVVRRRGPIDSDSGARILSFPK